MSVNSAYHQWKQWKLDFTYSFEEQSYYLSEFGEKIVPGRTIVEIGFGNGGFLAFARERGVNVLGIEIQEDILRQAREADFEVYDSLEHLLPKHRNQVDLAIALDVFEHMSHEEIRNALLQIEELLKPDANLIVRVPNGCSPLGRESQYGDCTHLTVVTGKKLAQLCVGTGLEVVEVRNAARAARFDRAMHRIGKKVQSRLRDIVNVALARIYSLETTALDPNIVIILRNVGR